MKLMNYMTSLPDMERSAPLAEQDAAQLDGTVRRNMYSGVGQTAGAFLGPQTQLVVGAVGVFASAYDRMRGEPQAWDTFKSGAKNAAVGLAFTAAEFATAGASRPVYVALASAGAAKDLLIDAPVAQYNRIMRPSESQN
ncbi:MAG: hypothetical protein AAFY60_08190 [Myxococcota bacterium]